MYEFVDELGLIAYQRRREHWWLDGLPLTKEGREYDMQRQKLYDAETDFLFRAESPDGVTAATTMLQQEAVVPYLEDLLERRSFRANFGRLEMPEVVFREQSDGLYRDSEHTIYLPRGPVMELLVLHELAHALAPRPHAWHGRLFCSSYACLVRLMKGDAVTAYMLGAMKDKSVRWRPER